MKSHSIQIGILSAGLALVAACAFAQQQGIQPSPAYYQSGGTVYQAVPPPASVQPAPGAQPALVAPQAQPVYLVPQPAVQAAPAPVDAEETDEEGIYWVWGQKWPGLALGPKIGTTGIGLEMTFGINPYLNLRSGFNYGSFTLNSSLGDVDYDMDVTMTSIPLMLDVQPFGGNFRLTGGLYIQPDSQADINATPTTPTQIGEHTYNPDTIGTLMGSIEVDGVVAPYLGIGVGNAVAEDQVLTCSVELGVIFQSYDTSLTSDGAGMTAKLDTFRQDIAKEAENIQKDMDDWKIFPVLTIGVAWHF